MQECATYLHLLHIQNETLTLKIEIMRFNLQKLLAFILVLNMSMTVFAQPVVINLESAGTLSTKIQEADKFNITELKIVGSLSNSDIFFIREMAGRGSKESVTDGKLISLDLSEATIVANEADGVYYDMDYNNQRTKDNEIGNFMFSKLKLQTIKLPNNIIKLGDYAFMESQIQSIDIPTNVTTVGSSVFAKCAKLTHANLGNIQNIPYDMFSTCDELQEINIPKGVTKIGSTAFQNCSSLSKIILPETINNIEFWAFKGTALTEFHIQATVPPTAGWGALEGIDKATCTLYVPVGAVDTYRNSTDWGFTNIVEESAVPDDKPVTQLSVTLTQAGTLCDQISEKSKWTIEDLTISGPLNGKDLAFIREMAGIDFSWKQTAGKLTRLDIANATLVYEGGYNQDGIREPVESDYYAYVEASLGSSDELRMAARQDALPEMVFTKTILEEVIMPNTIKKIYSSFSECYNLKGKVIIPEGVTTIGDWAFQGCGLIEEVVFPSTLVESDAAHPIANTNAICSHAFDGCASLKSISFPASVKALRDGTFQGCTGLTNLYQPATITTIDQMAFGGCTGLTTIEVESETPAIARYQAFDKVDKENCILIVPAGSRSAYKSADEWGEFLNIQEKGSEKAFTINIDHAAHVEATFGADAQPLILKDGQNILSIESFSNPLTIKAVEGYKVAMTLNGKEVTEESIKMGIGDVLDITTTQLCTVTFETASENGIKNIVVSYGKQQVEFTEAPYTTIVPANTTLILSAIEGYELTKVTLSDGTTAEILPSGECMIDITTDITISFEVEKEASSITSVTTASFIYNKDANLLYTENGSTIYTATGKLVGNFQSSPINTANLPSGLYIVKSAGHTFKFVK